MGDNLKLLLQAANSGPEDATGVKVNYSLPPSLEFLASPDVYDPQTGIWDIGNLRWGEATYLEIAAKAQKAGQAVNTATIMGNEADPNTENNTASLIIRVQGLSSGGSGTVTQPTNPPVTPPVNPPVTPVNPPNPNPPLPPTEPTPPDSPPLPPGPSPPTPPTEPQKPSTQLGRDIAGVRQAVSQGVLDESVIPDWNLEIGEPILDEEEIKEWTSFLIKLSIELIAFAAVSAISEYIQGIITAITNYFKVFNIVLKYFGINKYLKPMLDYSRQASNVLLKNTKVKSVVDAWSKILDVVSPNVGMKLLERALIKIFPSQTAEIGHLMTIISTKQFLEDPLGAINAIYDIFLGIFTSEPLEPADLEKLTIIEPMQSSG